MKQLGLQLRQTKIVATIGPVTGSKTMIERLIRAGMNVARLNLSHGKPSEHARYIQAIRQISQRVGSIVAILIDLPGPKFRTGRLRDGQTTLKKGASIVLTTRQITGDASIVSVNLTSLFEDIRVGDIVLVDDGAIQLRVTGKENGQVKCKIKVGGVLTEKRGLVIPGMHVSAPYITDAMKKDLEFAIEQRPDYLGLSYVSSDADVLSVKAILRDHNAEIPVISKIERGQAIKNFDRILSVSDGIMVARGDLGVDIPLENVPLLQKEIIHKCNRSGKPVIVATQMLESMVKTPLPTRAEVSDVANAILDGTDATMLSAETSIGNYPLQSMKMMVKIAREIECQQSYNGLLQARGSWIEKETDELISYNACLTAQQLGAVAIIAFTQSGSTARRVSKYRPHVPIVALTPIQAVMGRLALHWGVIPYLISEISSVDELFQQGATIAKRLRLAKAGDLIIITAGIPIGIEGTTNLLKVERV